MNELLFSLALDILSDPLKFRESFGATLPQNHVPPSSVSNMRIAFSSDGNTIYKPISNSSPPPYEGGDNDGVVGDAALQPINQLGGVNMNMGEPVKRKRGRPRKYGPDGGKATVRSPVMPGSTTPNFSVGFSSLPAVSVNDMSSLSAPFSASIMKKPRGRPPGSGNKQQTSAIGSAGTGITPHIITVQAGEDISSKIMSFTQGGSRAVCILSANGAISSVTLHQAATSGGTVTYEGRFEILSLSGSFLLSEKGGQRSRTGGLSVSMAGTDGRVLGGGVAGLLVAASPVQVILGSFISEGRKESKQKNPSENAYVSKLPHGSDMGLGSPPSHGTQSESSGGPGSQH